MKKEEISIWQGVHIWKSHKEYYGKYRFLHGDPYYQITQVGDIFFLWELDNNEPDSANYKIMKQSNNFNSLWEEGMKLNNEITLKK